MEQRYEFNEKTSIECYLRNKLVKDINDGEWIMLPFYKFRIGSPLIQDFKLNIFEKTILALLNEGVGNMKEISRLLDLDIELIETVLEGLRNQQFLDDDFSITHEGKVALLDGERIFFENTYEYQDGYIYQSAVDMDNIYPVFQRLEDVRIPEISFGKNGEHQYPRIRMSNNNVWKRVVYPKIEQLVFPIKPKVETVIRTVYRFNKKISFIDDLNIPKVFLQKVSIDEKAECVWIPTMIYPSKDAVFKKGWLAVSPFGFGIEDDIPKNILEILREKEQSGYLNDEIEKIERDVEKELKDSFSNAIRKVEVKAIEYLKKVFGNNLLDKDGNLRKYIFDFELAYQKMKYANVREGTLAKEAVIILERIFKIMYSNFRSAYEGIENKLLDALSNREREIENGDRIEAIVASHEGRTPLRQKALLKYFPDRIEKAVRDYERKGSLQDMMMTSLLATENDSNHYFVNVIKENPRALDEVLELIYERNKSSHASGENTLKDFTKVKLDRKNVYNVINSFLNQL